MNWISVGEEGVVRISGRLRASGLMVKVHLENEKLSRVDGAGKDLCPKVTESSRRFHILALWETEPGRSQIRVLAWVTSAFNVGPILKYKMKKD